MAEDNAINHYTSKADAERLKLQAAQQAEQVVKDEFEVRTRRSITEVVIAKSCTFADRNGRGRRWTTVLRSRTRAHPIRCSVAWMPYRKL